MARYTFICEEYDSESDLQFPVEKDIKVTLSFSDQATWDAVLDQFISFLSSVYGYDIHKSVKYATLDEKIKKLKKACDGLEESYDSKSLDLDDEDEDWRKIL